MSQVKVSGNASGTGILTIAAPNTSTNRTLTLPDQTGTFLTSATTTGFPAGSVLQVVQATLSGSVTTSAGSFVTTGLTASITPTSATSKILVTVSAGDLDSQAAGRQILATIYRNSTNLGNANGFMDVYDTAGRIIVPVSIQYLDSPATTSSTAYTLYFTGQGTTVVYNAQGGLGVITLMEIAA